MWTRKLGPRVRFGLSGTLSFHQTLCAAIGGVLALGILMEGSPSPWALLGALLVGISTAVLVLVHYKGMPYADWALKATAYLLSPKQWEARPVGQAAEQLPRELAGVEIVSVPDRSRTVGLIRERRTLTAVARLEVHSLGLFDEGEQARRLNAFERILDADLARDNDDRYRVALLAKHMPRSTNEELAYIQSHVRDIDSPQARSMLEVIGNDGDASHEDELYVCIRQSRTDSAEARLIDRVHSLVDRLVQADIAIKTPKHLLEAREVAGLIKDSFDPFGRSLRDQLERAVDEAGTDPAMAWPNAGYRYTDCFETDGALHATYWIRRWPRVAVSPGWMRPLTLRCDVPALTIATVLKPDDSDRALDAIRKKQTRFDGAAIFRRQHGKKETIEHGTRAEFLARQEECLTQDATPWWWETYVTTSAPDYPTLQASMRKVESACAECRLLPVPLNFDQANAFMFSLPLGRGLEPEKVRL